MQDTMDDDPVQFIHFWHIELRSIFTHAVNANENIASDDPFFFAMIKSDNIGKRIVVEILLVNSQQISVAAQNNADFPRSKAFGSSRFFDPPPDGCFLFGAEIRILGEKMNVTHVDFSQR